MISLLYDVGQQNYANVTVVKSKPLSSEQKLIKTGAMLCLVGGLVLRFEQRPLRSLLVLEATALGCWFIDSANL